MKLHRDRLSFLNVIGLVHSVTGIREDILEKDYYVTLLFKKCRGITSLRKKT